MMKIYLDFCLDYNLLPLDPSVSTILCYLEFLACRLKSPKSISNYWSAVKLIHEVNRVQLSNINDIQVKLMLRSLSFTKRHVSVQKLPLSSAQLQNMCSILDSYGLPGLTIKCALLIGFYGFLRASNICQQKNHSFDSSRHFTRSDVKITKSGLVLQLKWAKNMQCSLQPKNISIPSVKDESVDPAATFKRMCSLVPAGPNSPLFMLHHNQPLTVEKLRSVFRHLCDKIDLDHSVFSLHSLRRGGATEAYIKGATPVDIQRHGAWQSLTFWDYVYPTFNNPSTVCQALSS